LNIAQIFRSISGELKKENLIPVLSISPEKLLDRFGITQQDIHKIAQLLDVTADTLFYEPMNIINPFCYYEEYYYFPFPTLCLDAFQQLQLHERFHMQMKYMKKSLEEGAFDRFFLMLDKRVRMHSFRSLFHQIPDHKKFDTFLWIYQASEYCFDSIPADFIREVMRYRMHSVRWKPFHLEKPEAIGDDGFVTIYRGQQKESTPIEKAYSWTLDDSVAHWFAKRFSSLHDGGSVVYRAKVKPEDIIAYIDNRNEKEVLVFFETLRDVMVIGESKV
jgi:hypothetical protein